MILISRMSPIIPHSLVSYAAGLIRISFWRFTFASFIGFLPQSAAYTYVGAVVGKALRTSAGVTPHDPVTWIFYGLGLVATLIVTAITTRIARQSWKMYFAERTTAEQDRATLSKERDPEREIQPSSFKRRGRVEKARLLRD
jgi:hypothetical protein